MGARTPAPQQSYPLTPTEFDLYRDLVTDRFAERIRLTKNTDWRWVLTGFKSGS